MATMTSKCDARAPYPSLLTRISYHVGSPWIFDGNAFFPETGIPMRNTACMSKPLALAEPVPLTVAIFRAKSFIRARESRSKSAVRRRG